jgi:hypothetical protein
MFANTGWYNHQVCHIVSPRLVSVLVTLFKCINVRNPTSSELILSWQRRIAGNEWHRAFLRSSLSRRNGYIALSARRSSRRVWNACQGYPLHQRLFFSAATSSVHCSPTLKLEFLFGRKPGNDVASIRFIL